MTAPIATRQANEKLGAFALLTGLGFDVVLGNVTSKHAREVEWQV